jgi:hypothetical protein
MQTMTLGDTSVPDRQLRYVTTHFRDLQGLRMAPFWAALLVLTCMVRADSASREHLAAAAFAFGVAQFGWLYVSGHWYERHYGVVIAPEPAVRSEVISIMETETPSLRAPNRSFGHNSNKLAVMFLIYALVLLPGMFFGLRGRPGELAMMVTVFQILPRCLYPVTGDWLVLLRRIFACSALVAIFGIYIQYRFAQMNLWTWMAALLSILLLLDLYDHWLLNHFLGGDSKEWIDE